MLARTGYGSDSGSGPTRRAHPESRIPMSDEPRTGRLGWVSQVQASGGAVGGLGAWVRTCIDSFIHFFLTRSARLGPLFAFARAGSGYGSLCALGASGIGATSRWG
jgi:hypothetical protein